MLSLCDNISVLHLLVRGEGKEVKRVESKEGLSRLVTTVCTQLVKDLIPVSVLTSYSRRVEIHALANAIVLFLCVARVICA